MIYKFQNKISSMEVELFQDEDNTKDYVTFSINVDDNWRDISLDKQDVYHLIGALHLLQKEMR